MQAAYTVKSYAAFICVAAWSIAAVTLLVLTLCLPDKVVAFGVDISHSSHILLAKQAVYIACGLGLAVAACLLDRWRPLLVIVASLFYLSNWFPWKLVGKYGLTATAKIMYMTGSTPELRITSSIRDVVLPIAFIAAIALMTLNSRLRRSP